MANRKVFLSQLVLVVGVFLITSGFSSCDKTTACARGKHEKVTILRYEAAVTANGSDFSKWMSWCKGNGPEMVKYFKHHASDMEDYQPNDGKYVSKGPLSGLDVRGGLERARDEHIFSAKEIASTVHFICNYGRTGNLTQEQLKLHVEQLRLSYANLKANGESILKDVCSAEIKAQAKISEADLKRLQKALDEPSSKPSPNPVAKKQAL